MATPIETWGNTLRTRASQTHQTLIALVSRLAKTPSDYREIMEAANSAQTAHAEARIAESLGDAERIMHAVRRVIEHRGSGYDALASTEWDEVVRLCGGVSTNARQSQHSDTRSG